MGPALLITRSTSTAGNSQYNHEAMASRKLQRLMIEIFPEANIRPNSDTPSRLEHYHTCHATFCISDVVNEQKNETNTVATKFCEDITGTNKSPQDQVTLLQKLKEIMKRLIRGEINYAQDAVDKIDKAINELEEPKSQPRL